MTTRTAIRGGLAAAVSALVLACPAQASVISYDGDDLVLEAAPGEVNSVSVFQSPSRGIGWVRLGDGAGLSGPGDRCVVSGDGWIDCEATGAVYVALGDGDDSFGFGATEPLANPVGVLGGPGADVLRGNTHSATVAALVGEEGADRLEGGMGDEQLLGGPGDDQLTGRAGDDTLRGEDGDDTLDGDRYDAPGADLIDGGAGTDTVAGWSDPGADRNPPVTLTIDGRADDGRPGEGDDVRDVERVEAHVNGVFEFGDADDFIDVWSNLSGGASRLVGRGGDDRLRGGSNEETMDGGPGADRIEGGFGHDTITGGPGRDTIYGDKTGANCGLFESCDAPYGNDTIFAADGEADMISCGVGQDRAVVDGLDTVDGCEVVERSGAPGAGGPGGPGAGTGGARRTRVTASARRRGARILVTGRLVRPAGVAARACAGRRVSVAFARGGVSRRVRARLDARCRFRAASAAGRGRVVVTIRFAGAGRLPAAPARRLVVR